MVSGGRTTQKALRGVPARTASTAFSTPPACSAGCDVPRVGRDFGVAGAQVGAAGVDIAAGGLEVGGGVAELQFVIGGGAGLGAAHAGEQSGVGESRDNGVVAFGLFGMCASDEVSAAPVIGDARWPAG